MTAHHHRRAEDAVMSDGVKIDGVPWRTYLWLCVKTIVFGGLVGAAFGGGIDRLLEWFR